MTSAPRVVQPKLDTRWKKKSSGKVNMACMLMINHCGWSIQTWVQAPYAHKAWKALFTFVFSLVSWKLILTAHQTISPQVHWFHPQNIPQLVDTDKTHSVLVLQFPPTACKVLLSGHYSPFHLMFLKSDQGWRFTIIAYIFLLFCLYIGFQNISQVCFLSDSYEAILCCFNYSSHCFQAQHLSHP